MTLVIYNTPITNPCEKPRFLNLGSLKFKGNPYNSDERSREEVHLLEGQNLQRNLEITVDIQNLCPPPIPFHETVNIKVLPILFITTSVNLFVSDFLLFRLLQGSITFLITLTYFKYTAHF